MQRSRTRSSTWALLSIESKQLWRGGLPPFGCAAVVKSSPALCLMHPDSNFGAASRPNGGKPPRHRVIRSHKTFVRCVTICFIW
ncbi:hypothetical protein C2E19_24630 [Pseudomonas sp. DTU12.3]|nr:hypothetical protein C2E19_24630 [Pseudomonas sp. DTU12.3]